ncbi:DUF6702 family protein [Croceivirga thetidis]|uniref:Peptidase E n=1 Tax=Croceivirga thetidis TaxID=2721623 RepID=A0ABX1GKA4_9FLAO|nr:DUF6702 family protein [Croceivirga thetidis]NKI30322.1 hypothetical protein [Croceivirga thetidis]
MKKFLLALTLILMSFSTMHKFYVSVTNVNYSEKNDSFEITTRVFIDDLESVLKERYDIKAALDTSSESDMADFYIEKYLRAKLVVEIDGEPLNYTYLGKKYDADLVLFYLEVENVGLSNLKSLAIYNEILTDLYDEQKNIVHIKWKGDKKSFVLTKSDAKGMLNF